MGQNIVIRKIELSDNPILANIVRGTLTEFGVNRPGTVFADPETDQMFSLYSKPRTVYYNAEVDGKIVGGAGIAPLQNGDPSVCELQKMYLLPEARGLGLGKVLIEKCLAFAKENGFKQCYLETLPELSQAVKVYEKFGFKKLDKPMGNTGHFSCDVWMIKDLV